MTKVVYDTRNDEYILEASGHANYDISGRDIVCAGISTLLQTLLLYTPQNDIKLSRIETSHIYCHVAGHDACVCAEMVLCGLKALQEQYPDHIDVKKGDLF